jgi:hypothetical protein
MSTRVRSFRMRYQTATDKLYNVVITDQTAYADEVGKVVGAGAERGPRDFDLKIGNRVNLTIVNNTVRNQILNGELHPSAVCVRQILSGPAALSSVLT